MDAAVAACTNDSETKTTL